MVRRKNGTAHVTGFAHGLSTSCIVVTPLKPQTQLASNLYQVTRVLAGRHHGGKKIWLVNNMAGKKSERFESRPPAAANRRGTPPRPARPQTRFRVGHPRD